MNRLTAIVTSITNASVRVRSSENEPIHASNESNNTWWDKLGKIRTAKGHTPDKVMAKQVKPMLISNTLELRK